ncbi:branched-chain amino acid transport system II carrier protein [Candidatus Dependentiae bacterium]|nr:branched-chain amino acid transport system II carrier protein [Candidatus Dependentiae bacterium]
MSKQITISSSKIGLAIFTMLFGAGNIIYPIKAGLTAGSSMYTTFWGFLITSVMLPIIGLVTMILFDGDYQEFFNRIGKVPGSMAITFCMFILGPLLVMPRCVTVPYDILSPFFPHISISIFSLIFCSVAFILAYKESKIFDLMSKYICWILLGSIGFIITAGIWFAQTITPQSMSTQQIFFDQLLQGFQTLDLIGSLFFAYIIVRLIKLNATTQNLSTKKIAFLCLKGSVISGLFMTLFYIGLGLLGAYYGHLVNPYMNGAELFRTITMHVTGSYGVIILVIGVLMACISTLVALAAVFSEYLRQKLLNNKINYIQSLSITLLVTTVISNFGLSNILKFGFPVVNFGYPIIVVITLCNAGYKLFGLKMIKLPVFITTVAMIWITFLI